ncbi:nucleotide exchange factor GrpE [Portibacter marinus]|uniref:nucleotide exchange factor GrpE n=1 Tax=Portibacter marinus TaxID=2898660 RepID=UPI001F3BA53F|nr:nucleotide exchange factor GrpE [Portibacter marinus]
MIDKTEEKDMESPEIDETQDTQEDKPKRGWMGGKKDSKLKKELEDKEIELAEAKDKYLRLFAEFDNYKKRSIKERLDLMKSAAQDTIKDLLPVLDDFARAKQSAEAEGSSETFSEGVALVYNKLLNTLKSKGLEAMDTNGEEFNPEFHEAITKVPAPSEEMKGKILDTVTTGYKLHDKIIRHPKVVVGE